MIQARDALDIIRTKNRNNPAWINQDLYRLLYNPTLHILAYERIKSKPGNMTPGADGQTLDGFSLAEIQKRMAELRSEQYQPTPVRRIYIPKSKGLRPLGIPSPQDKIVQECLRLILEAIYEPTFHDNSHGFRPQRSCHTALENLKINWNGVTWAIQADITECFERINHHRLLDILQERIRDDRFSNLIRKFLKAGYLENWVYHRTYSGSPQGSISSPILTNIYLDKLDRELATISQRYTNGKRRKRNSTQVRLIRQRRLLLEQGATTPSLRDELQNQLRDLNHRILQTPSADYHHPTDYTRVKFMRYADDVIVGVIGPRALAEQVREDLASFLAKDLKLELNQCKTRIYHLTTEKIPFLGYEFKTAPARLRRRNLRRKGSRHNVVQTTKTGSGNITLLVPLKELTQKLKPYMAKGQPASVGALIHQPVDHIIEHYNGLMRGWYNYYQLAHNVSALHYTRYILRYSLAKTLAQKERSSLKAIFRKYGPNISYLRPTGREIHFFNQPLRQVKKVKRHSTEMDTRPTWWPKRTTSRLLDHCAICTSPDKVEMHHLRHIRKRGHALKGFSLYMAAINRKQLPVCRQCHLDIHQGKYDGASLSEILERLPAPEIRT